MKGWIKYLIQIKKIFLNLPENEEEENDKNEIENSNNNVKEIIQNINNNKKDNIFITKLSENKKDKLKININLNEDSIKYTEIFKYFNE